MASITSSKSGLWSDPTVWTGGVVPVLGDKVTIAAGHTVTVDGTYAAGDDTTTALNVLGTLKASRTVSSQLTVRGQLYSSIAVWPNSVYIDYGTEADPIPAGVTATLVVNDSASPAISKYPLNITWGMKFTMWGATKKAWSRLNGAIAIGATSFVVDDATNWAIGDRVMIADTGTGLAFQGDYRTITGKTGSTISVAATTFAHADRAVVGNLTRNVTVKPANASFPVRVFVDFANTTAAAAAGSGYGGRYEFGYCAFEDLGTTSTALHGLSFSTRDFFYETVPAVRVIESVACYVTTLSGGAAAGSFQVTNVAGGFNPYPVKNLVACGSNSFGSGSINVSVGGAAIAAEDCWALSGNRALFFSAAQNTSWLRGGCASGGGECQFNGNNGLDVTDADFGALTNIVISEAYATKFKSCRFGRGAGNGKINNNTSRAFNVAPSGVAGVMLAGLDVEDCTLPAVTYTESTLAETPWSNGNENAIMRFTRPNGENRIEWKRKRGTMYSDTTTTNRGDTSIRFVLSLAGKPAYYPLSVPTSSGVPVTVVGYMRKNASYGSTNLPSVMLSGLGIVPVSATMTDVNDTWQKFTLTATQTSGNPGNLTLTWAGSFNGTAGSTMWLDGVYLSPFTTTVRHYGYLFDTNIYRAVDPVAVLSEAAALAVAGVAIDHVTQRITVTADVSIRDLYDACRANLCQTANLGRAEFLISTNGTAFTSTYGLTLTNASLTGTGTMAIAGTLVMTGAASSSVAITASNGNTAKLSLAGLTNATVAVFNGAGTQVDVQVSVTGTYNLNIAVGATGTWSWKVAKYGYLAATGTFSPGAGGLISALPALATDVGVTQPAVATVAAYTDLGSLDRLYDYCAYFETTSAGVPLARLATKAGITVDLGSVPITYSSAASGFAYSGGAITVGAAAQIEGVTFQRLATTGAVTLIGTTLGIIYSSSGGTSGRLVLTGLAGATVYVKDGTGALKALAGGVTGDFTLAIAAGAVGTWSWKVAKYGYLAASGTFPVAAGGLTSFLPSLATDVGVTQPTASVVAAYTDFGSLDRLYDYCAYFEATTAGIVTARLAAKAGSTLDLGSVNLVYDSSAVGFAYAGGGITVRALSTIEGVTFQRLTTLGSVTLTGVTNGIIYTSSAGTSARLVLQGLTNTAVRVEDASGVQQDFQPSVTGTYTWNIPPAAVGTWRWSVKRPGRKHATSSFVPGAGGITTVAPALPQKLNADGTAMYSGSSSALCAVSFVGVNTAYIDVADGVAPLQSAFDETEDALCTAPGLAWLAAGRDDVGQFNSASGDFLFLSTGWRLRRASPTDTNATIQAFAVSTEGIPVDESNGPVRYLATDSATTIAQAVRFEIERVGGMLAAVQAAVSAPMAADVRLVNGVQIKGTGRPNDTWGPV